MKTSLPQVAHVVSIADESARTRLLVLDHHLAAEPGQFVMAWLPGIDEKPFSLVCADPVTLMVARVGPFSTAIHALKIGDSLWLRGPLGNGFWLPAEGPSAGALLLIGGGYGMAPLHLLAERAIAAGWVVSMVIGARTAADVVLSGRLAALGAQVTITTDDGTLGQRGVATEAAARLLNEHSFQTIYACGPEPMLVAVERLALARHLPAQLSYEGHMRCGLGVCGSCARQGWLVCRDGPVKAVHAER
jgi:dihydroorotate dehydrogenase electron transfer subunit